MFQAETKALLNAALPPLPADPFAPDQPGRAPSIDPGHSSITGACWSVA
ncbi:MAG: hypothetical protein JO114_07405 [Planctomycetaceae bacterium]|nr:hypothetical protein [Planctomycetaceae bacterium]MBV8309961.1 hypothetical protein [Planctomycetaceae bacterium]